MVWLALLQVCTLKGRRAPRATVGCRNRLASPSPPPIYPMPCPQGHLSRRCRGCHIHSHRLYRLFLSERCASQTLVSLPCTHNEPKTWAHVPRPAKGSPVFVWGRRVLALLLPHLAAHPHSPASMAPLWLRCVTLNEVAFRLLRIESCYQGA